MNFSTSSMQLRGIWCSSPTQILSSLHFFIPNCAPKSAPFLSLQPPSHLTPADTFSQLHFQNLVMFMSEFVDWIIPDIPKDISQQIHKEKVLMVEVFMREEQGKLQMLETWKEKDKNKGENCNNHSPRLSRSRSGSLSSCHSYPLDV